jgi:parallel beta-helix repeat protein
MIFDNNDGIVIYEISNFAEIINNDIHDNGQGLSLQGTGNIVVKNSIHDNIDGVVFLAGSSGGVITENDINDHTGTGILLITSNDITIEDNTIWNDVMGSNTWGIHLGSSHNNVITRNEVFRIEFAFSLSWSTSNQLEDNLSHDNVNGMIINENSNNNNFTSNEVIDNVHGIGIDTDNNLVEFNTISENQEQGIHIGGEGNIILNNTISLNNLGVELISVSTNNVIRWNEFFSNNVGGSQAMDDGVNNTFESNYWDDWTGPDTDGDGIVDEPYIIPSLSDPNANMDQKPIAGDQVTTTTSTTSSETKTTTTSTTEPSQPDDTSDSPSAFLSFSTWYLGIFLLGFIGIIRRRK